jgi:5-methylcytosine-specific restriction endonuclease McrA
LWQKENPEKLKNYGLKKRKHNITIKEWQDCKNYFNNECAYCGLPIENNYVKYANKLVLSDLHKEHVDDVGSDELDNCVPACKVCNSEKGSYRLDDWYNKENKKWSEERYNKIINWINDDYKQYINN